jgi:uncharacterized protein YihD (DUF1040 family)
MRDPKRIEKVLNIIRGMWHTYPDMRLCQLLGAAANVSGWKGTDLFYLEDDQLVEGLDKLLKEYNA